MSENNVSKRIFALSFCVTFLVLGLLVAGTVLALSPKAVGESSAPQYALKERESGYLPSADESLSVLFIGAEDADALPGSFLLAGFEPLTGRIPLLALPPELKVTLGGRSSTLAQTYRTSGATGAKVALAETLGVPVERYVRMDLPGFVDVASLVGQVEYELPYTVTFEKYGTLVAIDSGYQRLDGKRAADLATYAGYPGGELGRMKVLGELAAAVVNQRLSLALSPKVEAIFRQVLSFLDTDISFRDYEYRVQAARFLAKLQVNPATCIPTMGEFSQDGSFQLSQTTLNLVKKLFHTAPGS